MVLLQREPGDGFNRALMDLLQRKPGVPNSDDARSGDANALEYVHHRQRCKSQCLSQTAYCPVPVLKGCAFAQNTCQMAPKRHSRYPEAD